MAKIDEKEMKRIHGADVDLKTAPDPKDEQLSEADAVARAKRKGIQFIDIWKVEGSEERYSSLADAEKAAAGKNVIQTRILKDHE